MKIIHQPIPAKEGRTTTPDGMDEVRADQMVFKASLTRVGRKLLGGEHRFPVIFDTGNNADFAIRRSQLVRWSNLSFDHVQRDVRVNGVKVEVEKAALWIHGLEGPFPLVIEPGMYVYPDDDNPARLPILGLRAILRNKLKLLVDGKRRMVTLST